MSAPVPLVLIGFLNWVGVGPRGFGDKVLGTVLDNKHSTRPGVDKVKP